MKILYYDCFSGISGDMNLAAMIDLGVSKELLLSELEKLNLKGWELEVSRDQRHGITGTKVRIRLTRREHHHRHLSDIEKIIMGSSLENETKELAMKIFMRVAEAEAHVHNIPVGKVHFHEVGAVDSIVDITGAAVCFRALGIEQVHVSVLELGGGMVKCDHGKLPVPAPATAEILKNIPVTRGAVDFEATTPTGAAIVATLGNVFNKPLPIKIIKTGYGIGHREHDEIPNVLRVHIAESEENGTGHEAVLLECNIDDMNPEIYGTVSDRLFAAGASDVFMTGIMMKKGRPGILLSVISEKERSAAMKEILFTETTTLGIRTTGFIKDTLARKFEKTVTSLGPVTVKRSYYKGREVSCKPESEDCIRISVEKGIPLKEVYRIIGGEIKGEKG